MEGVGILLIGALAATLGVIQVVIASPILASADDGNIDGEVVANDQQDSGQLSDIEHGEQA